MNIFNNTFEPYFIKIIRFRCGRSPTKQEQCDEKFKIIRGVAYWGNEFRCCQYNCRRIED